MEKIQAFPAGEFVCENCGRNNYFSLIAADLPQDVMETAKKEIKDELGINQVSGHFLLQPKAVKCRYCGGEYEVDFIS